MAYKTAPEMFGDGGGFGPAVPYSTSNPPGTSAGNRGIQFGEQLTAAIANRTHYALALNTDDLNTRLAVFEVGGLDAAYDNGTIGPSGGGREITKDGGAVETTSSLATQYADDPANAHFRANATGDTTPGGGFDYRGLLATLPAYGFMSRVNAAPGVTYTSMSATEAVTLNPGGVGGDVVRFTGAVHNGTDTDVGLDGLDFLEITGAGSASGLYRVFSLGPTNFDLRVRRLDGAAPAFGVGVAATSMFFIAHMMSSAMTAGLSLRAALALSAEASADAVLALVGRDVDGLAGTGPARVISFYYQDTDGGTNTLAGFTSSGRFKSAINSDAFSSATARTIEWAEAGIPIINIDKAEGGGSGYHEIGVLVREQGGASSSWAGLETRGTLLETTVLGINASIPGTFAAPMGTIILPDSDGAPAPPAGQFKTLWALGVQPGVTLVRILTGSGSGRYYLLSAVNLTAAGAIPDEIVVTHIDGSALDPGELPTVGALTFQFVQRQTVGGKLPPITLETAPAAYTAPADLTPSTVVAPPTETTGDPGGVAAMGVRGSVFGFRSYDLNTVVLPSTVHADVSWVITNEGQLYAKGEIISDALVQGESMRVNNSFFVTCEQTDRTYNVDLRTGQPEEDASGAPLWRFDRTNGDWELITLGGGGNSAIWFPITFSGRLMETYVQAFAGAGAVHSVYAALAITTPDWGTPANAPGIVNANETTIVNANGAWGEDFINHSLGLGTLLNLGSNNYAIRIRGERVGDRIRAIKFVIRFILIGPGGVGG